VNIFIRCSAVKGDARASVQRKKTFSWKKIQAFIAGPSHINFSTAGNLLFLDDTRAIPYQQHLHFCRRRMQEAAVF
jgi:site-specific DNA-cytosine methylase